MQRRYATFTPQMISFSYACGVLRNSTKTPLPRSKSLWPPKIYFVQALLSESGKEIASARMQVSKYFRLAEATVGSSRSYAGATLVRSCATTLFPCAKNVRGTLSAYILRARAKSCCTSSNKNLTTVTARRTYRWPPQRNNMGHVPSGGVCLFSCHRSPDTTASLC